MRETLRHISESAKSSLAVPWGPGPTSILLCYVTKLFCGGSEPNKSELLDVEIIFNGLSKMYGLNVRYGDSYGPLWIRAEPDFSAGFHTAEVEYLENQ